MQAELDALSGPRLRIDLDRDVIYCAERALELSPVRCAIYGLLAERRHRGCGEPSCGGCSRCFLPVGDIRESFAMEMRAWLETRGGRAVRPGQWNERNFRSERSKINRAIRNALHGASDVYEIRFS